ncbi:MAG: hypothetical protein M3N18_06020 [Actinomycetota bacterium]|nr:hypothetical protein [Actinomycetota bacterium]
MRELQQKRERYDRELAARQESERISAARAELEREKDFQRRQYMEAGVDPADFDRNHWPHILRDMMSRKVTDREARADTSLFD